MMDPNRLKGIIMVVIGACLWGLSGTAAQQLFQYDNISTEWLVTIRLLISGIILLIIASFGTSKKEIFGIWKQRSDAYKMILLVYSVCLLYSIRILLLLKKEMPPLQHYYNI